MTSLTAPILLLVCSIVLWITSSSPTQAKSLDLASERMNSKNYNPAGILLTANELISLGQIKADGALEDLAKTKMHDGIDEMDRDSYVAWLCLLIYDPKSGIGLPRPSLGGPDFPNTGFVEGPNQSTLNSSKWSRFPLAMKRQVPLLLVRGYAIGGLALPIHYFIDECHSQGTFRTEQYAIPTPKIAKAALHELLASPEWHALNWKEMGGDGSFYRDRKIEFLNDQMQRIKAP